MRLVMALVVLFGFLASLALQGLAEPDESPRSEIERLIGVDIATATDMDMDMSADLSDCDSGQMVMKKAAHGGPQSGHHHHDASCALCPLLQFAVFILGASAIALFVLSIRLNQSVCLPPCRAPPPVRWVLPLAQAPPSILA